MSTGKASAIIAAGTMVSRVLGFVKMVLLAVAIGQSTSKAAEAFGMANQLPNNVYALVAGGVMSAVLVPQIVKASKGADNGESYVSKILTLGGTVFLVLTIVATIAAPLLVDIYAISAGDDGRGFSDEQMALAVALAYWCMPQILFYAIYTLLGEIYNARSQFGPYTWAPVVNNIVSIAGLGAFILLFGTDRVNKFVDVWDADRITMLGLVTTGGVAVQALVLVLFFRKTGLRFRLDFGWRGVGLGATGKAALWLFGIVIIGQVKGIVQSRVASLGEGANIATMQNSWYVFSLPHSIIAVSIAIAFFTRMSHHAARDDLSGIRLDVSSALRSVGMLTTISAFVLAVIAVPFSRMLEGGFDPTLAMAFTIWAFLVCLVAFSAEFVLQRVFFALGDTRTAFLYSCVGMFITFALLWWASTLPAEWVIAGTALSVSIANLISCAVWLVLVRRRIGQFGFKLIGLRHVQYLAYSLVAAAAGVAVTFALGGYRADGFGTATVASAAITCVIAGAVMGAVYFALLYLTRNPDFRTTVDLVLARFRRGRGQSDAAEA
ncbi:murein biosynthesis integral membrane protein MurJ [Agrococcus sp. Marseille-Q4369]|uniref:murein biosynthesis integral membrane protein MurJ n=1 Tax=Agrococcus sp. Marseille-Q4369 TaxID=2810513 RepID=UPI001B8B2403|nr:murein biosynthesis integral membrane protein MurJ [Agrococcus sp. Marseille-Q4369]QUW17981.1 murein biosynthesis integral membrane protein MurJ [Agrococcus sp. Marseille-Q4369]